MWRHTPKTPSPFTKYTASSSSLNTSDEILLLITGDSAVIARVWHDTTSMQPFASAKAVEEPLWETHERDAGNGRGIFRVVPSAVVSTFRSNTAGAGSDVAFKVAFGTEAAFPVSLPAFSARGMHLKHQ